MKAFPALALTTSHEPLVTAFFANFDPRHLRCRRADVQPVDQGLNRGGFSGNEYFHAAIRQIARIAFNRELGCPLAGRGAIENALYPA